jgi:hypothetical protein
VLATAESLDITGTFVTGFLIGVLIVKSQLFPFIRAWTSSASFLTYGSEMSFSGYINLTQALTEFLHIIMLCVTRHGVWIGSWIY